MFLNIVLVFLGSGFGGVSRYIISLIVSNSLGKSFPFGTITVNILGCIIIGVLSALGNQLLIKQDIKLLLIVGFCGGFTTFSSFSLETLSLIQNKEYFYAGLNVIISLFFGILGIYLAINFMNLINQK